MASEYGKIIDLLVSELGKMSENAQYVRRSKREIIQKTIEKYLSDLSNVEKELLVLIQEKHQTLLDENRREQFMNSTSPKEISRYLTKAKEDLQKQIKSRREEQTYAELKALFITGYKLVMTLREYFLNDSILYEVASETGNFTFEIDEESFLEQSRASLSSLNLVLQDGQLNIDFVQKINIGKKLKEKAEESGYKIYENLGDENGSTFWSRGIRILHALQEEKELSGGSRGLNFGHFYEAYKYFNGNEINFSRKDQPGNTDYAAVMLALRNSNKFYKGGDVDNVQLKANEATITHISTIRKQLSDILKILTNKQINARQQLSQIKESFVSSGAESSIEELIEKKRNEILQHFAEKGPMAIHIFWNL